MKAFCTTCLDIHTFTDGVCPKCNPKTKVSFEGVVKVCNNCSRVLSSRCYIYDQTRSDKLRDTCRSCEAYLHGKPTLEQVSIYEAQVYRAAQVAAKRVDGQIIERRSEFETLVFNEMRVQGVLTDWKPPVWVHESSRIDSDDH